MFTDEGRDAFNKLIERVAKIMKTFHEARREGRTWTYHEHEATVSLDSSSGLSLVCVKRKTFRKTLKKPSGPFLLKPESAKAIADVIMRHFNSPQG
jgi:hypothetical protein